MKEIKILARAGQGAITTATLLGTAVYESGKYAYAFPHFGAARMGAAMNAFVRIDDKPVRDKSQIKIPDYLIVIDSTLIPETDLNSLVKHNGIIIINQQNKEKIVKETNNVTIYYVAGNEIAQEILRRPLGNTVLVGAFAYVTKEFGLDSLINSINKRFKGKVSEQNIELAKRGYEYLK